jgi:hypothetical protein
MADTLGKIVARVPAATSSTSNLFADARALTSGAGHISVVSDLNHLMNISATGPVFTHQGLAGFFRGPTGGVMSSPPQPAEVGWYPPGPDSGALNYRVSLRVDPYAPGVLPVLRLRCWLTAPPSGTESSGVVLAIGTAVNPDMRYISAVTTNTSGEDIDLTLALEGTDLFPANAAVTLGYTSTGAPSLGEPYAESVVTAWIGFINTSDKNSDVADALGIVLSLEYP